MIDTNVVYTLIAVALAAGAGYYFLVYKKKSAGTVVTPTPAPTPTPTPAPTPSPAPTPAPSPTPVGGLAKTYVSVAALIAAAEAIKFSNAITVDGKIAYPGFGPALGYTTQGDGTLAR